MIVIIGEAARGTTRNSPRIALAPSALTRDALWYLPSNGTYATVQPCDLSCTATEALGAEPAVALGGDTGQCVQERKNGRPVDLARDWRLRRAARGDELIEAHVFDGHDGAFTKVWASDWS
jgi:hypothetical protein